MSPLGTAWVLPLTMNDNSTNILTVIVTNENGIAATNVQTNYVDLDPPVITITNTIEATLFGTVDFTSVPKHHTETNTVPHNVYGQKITL